MRYYGIKTPPEPHQDSYIWWISDKPANSWRLFFNTANKDGRCCSYGLPLEEAQRAYEAIGYSCVKLDVKEMEKEASR